MKSVGIIAEFNPFHYGHKYFIECVKKMFPDYAIVCVMSGNFTERGDVSIMDKWNKTHIALENGVDIVIEIPFFYATQSADYFASCALRLLNEMDVSAIVFGSESNDINNLYSIAYNQIKSDSSVKKIINNGINYPTAISYFNGNVYSPNDILGICYIKEIIKNNYDIKAYCVKRTSDFNSNELSKICSSSAIRDSLKNGIDISNYIPYDISLINYTDLNNYFDLIRYEIISNNHLNKILGVDEGIENRLKKFILCSDNIDDFIAKVKCKRYTYNRIRRMLVHILCNVYKDQDRSINYIRILGFSDRGQKYLSGLKCNLNIVYSYKRNISSLFDLEYKSSCIYNIVTSDKEYKNSVIKF